MASVPVGRFLKQVFISVHFVLRPVRLYILAIFWYFLGPRLVRLAHLLLVNVFCAQTLWGREILILHPLRLLNTSAGYYFCCCRRLWVARQRFEYHDPLKTRHEELFQPTAHRPINNGQHFHHTRHRRLFHDEVGLKHSGLSHICQIW